jgi:hypothetical protein
MQNWPSLDVGTFGAGSLFDFSSKDTLFLQEYREDD